MRRRNDHISCVCSYAVFEWQRTDEDVFVSVAVKFFPHTFEMSNRTTTHKSYVYRISLRKHG